MTKRAAVKKPAAKRAVAKRSVAKKAVAKRAVTKRLVAKAPAAKTGAAARKNRSGTTASSAAARSGSLRGPARRTDSSAGRKALGRVDGVRGQRDGPTVTRSRVRNRGRRRLVGGLAATVISVGVLFVGVFPVNTYRTQRAATVKAEAQLRDVQAERARVKQASQLLQTDPEIERRAREWFGYQLPDEQIYNVLPAPADPIGLPDAWPFAGVERLLGG